MKQKIDTGAVETGLYDLMSRIERYDLALSHIVNMWERLPALTVQDMNVLDAYIGGEDGLYGLLESIKDARHLVKGHALPG